MIDILKAKADAEEGLRIAEPATEGPIYVRRYDNEGGYLSFQLTQGYERGENSAVLCEFDDLDNPRAPMDAAFYADSRTRAPEAYRNVIALVTAVATLREALDHVRDIREHTAKLYNAERVKVTAAELAEEEMTRKAEEHYDRAVKAEAERDALIAKLANLGVLQ